MGAIVSENTVNLFLEQNKEKILKAYKDKFRNNPLTPLNLIQQDERVYMGFSSYYDDIPDIFLPILRGDEECIDWLDHLNLPELAEEFDGWDRDENPKYDHDAEYKSFKS